MRIEVLVVPGCPHAEAAHRLVEAILEGTGVAASVLTTVVSTPEQAQDRGFTGSPTFLIEGRDPFAAPGAVAGVACRLYPTADGLSGLPDRDELTAAIRAAAEG